jgi:hypothetical protein
VYLVSSDDGGQNWSLPNRINDDTSPNSHFLPKLAIDQSTGNIAIAWYDARNDYPGLLTGDTDTKWNDDVEVYITVSQDGGKSFLQNVQVSSNPSNASAMQGENSAQDFGDYLGLAFEHGMIVPAWADNSAMLEGNPNALLSSNSQMLRAGLNIALAMVSLE